MSLLIVSGDIFYTISCSIQNNSLPLHRKSEKSALQTYFIKAFALFGNLFISRQFEFLSFRNTAKRSRLYVGFLYILEIDRSRDLNEPITVAHVFVCLYVSIQQDNLK